MRVADRALAHLSLMTWALQIGVGPALAQEAEPVVGPFQSSPVSFPREVAGEAGTVVIHTPQIDSWKDYR